MAGYGVVVEYDQHSLRLKNTAFKESRKVKQKPTENITPVTQSEIRRAETLSPQPPQQPFPASLSQVFKTQGHQLDESSQEQLPFLSSATCSHHRAMDREMKLHGDLQKTTTRPQVK